MRLLALLLSAVSLLPGATFYLTVAGLGGEAEFEQRFASAAKDLDKIFRQGADAQVVTLQGADATKAKMRAALAEMAKQAKLEDTVVVTLIGHGGFDWLPSIETLLPA